MSRRRLTVLLNSFGRPIEPPPCHDPSCGACEKCEKRSPVGGEPFRVLLERARPKFSPFRRVLREGMTELRQRQAEARREEQLAALAKLMEEGVDA